MTGSTESRAGRNRDAPPIVESGRWTVLRLIQWSAGYLAEKGIEQARLDAEHLLAHSLSKPRLQLYLEFDRPLTPEELADFKPLLLRRAAREPVQYIVGRTAFRELELRTDARALIPRPETEVLVEVVLDLTRNRNGITALDIGTGTGCIALSLAREGPFATVDAVDLSADALDLARENAGLAELTDQVTFLHGSLYEPLAADGRYDVIVSNPPYIAETDRPELQVEVGGFEPEAALFGGSDGLSIISAIIDGAPARLLPGGLLALEVGLGQADAVEELIRRTGAFQPARTHKDWTGRPRIVTAIRED